MFAVAACSTGHVTDDERNGRDRQESGAVLSSKGDGAGGGISLGPPKRGASRWSLTFSLIPLCTLDGSRVTLESVSWRTKTPGLEIDAAVRQVPEAAKRDPSIDYEPFVLRGRPEHRPDFGGTFISEVAGVEVSQACDEIEPELARTDLAIVLTADERGAMIDRLAVTYDSSGHRHELIINWSVALCGRDVDDSGCP